MAHHSTSSSTYRCIALSITLKGVLGGDANSINICQGPLYDIEEEEDGSHHRPEGWEEGTIASRGGRSRRKGGYSLSSCMEEGEKDIYSSEEEAGWVRLLISSKEGKCTLTQNFINISPTNFLVSLNMRAKRALLC